MRTFLPITLRVKPYYMRVQKTTREFTCDLKEPIARGPAQESGNFEKNQLRGFNGPSQKGRDRSLYSASTKAPAQITEPAIPPLWILRPGIMPLPHTRPSNVQGPHPWTIPTDLDHSISISSSSFDLSRGFSFGFSTKTNARPRYSGS